VLNPAAGRLLGIALNGTQTAASLGLADLISADPPVRFVTHIAGRSGRWQVVRGTFRESGLAQHLLIISDVRQALREEERLAWQRLIRVIGHEVNNSLTPIKSMAQSLEGALARELMSGKTRDDALAALRVIAERAGSLGRFLKRYGSLARLPPARRRWQALAPLVERVAALEPLRGMKLEVPPGLEANIDEDQLEQALINLAKNAVEAQPDRAGRVTLTVQTHGTDLRIVITDEGSGVTNLDNLFVPFFTTKPKGGGVGLFLARQIAEAHGGTLSLENRTDRNGAAATLDLPGSARGRLSG
jgi:nitrogen fixation/metabolism regulation signal transduction histidine kinase